MTGHKIINVIPDDPALEQHANPVVAAFARLRKAVAEPVDEWLGDNMQRGIGPGTCMDAAVALCAEIVARIWSSTADATIDELDIYVANFRQALTSNYREFTAPPRPQQ